MVIPKDYLEELHKTREFSDSTFKVEGEADIRVHKALIAAHSPVLKRFFQQHQSKADLFDLFSQDLCDRYTKTDIRNSMTNIFTWCYLESYSRESRETSTEFKDLVLPYLLTMSLAIHLEMQSLVDYCAGLLGSVFKQYALGYANAREYTQAKFKAGRDHIQAAFKKCFSRSYLNEFGFPEQVIQLLEKEAVHSFVQIAILLVEEKDYENAVWLQKAVPEAMAKLGWTVCCYFPQ